MLMYPSESREVHGEIVLVRHGQTAWSAMGRHTGSTDIALNDAGRRNGERLRARFAVMPYDGVYSSPLVRARETAVLAGLYGAIIVDDLREWDYGEYEGLTTAQILALRPGWDLFIDGCPGGDSPRDMDERADRVLSAVTPDDEQGARIVLVAHGHFLRVFAARWLGFDAYFARYLHLDTASLSVLSTEHQTHVIRSWNT